MRREAKFESCKPLHHLMNKFLLTGLLAVQLQAHAQTVLTGMPQPDQNVWAIQRTGNKVYIGGSFQNINGASHPYLASFDATTGSLATWNPGVDGTVYALAIAGGKLIVGGNFSNAGSQPRPGICMFDIATGNLEPWNPNNTFLVEGLGTHNNYFYYCGMVSGEFRLLCVEAISGIPTGWQSDDLGNFEVKAILRSGSYVYAAGSFYIPSISQNNLCRFNATTGALDLSFHPALSGSTTLYGLAEVNGIVYVGGSFTSIAGQTRNGLAGFDAAGNLTPFNLASSSSQIWSMCAAGDYLWVGGNSHTYGTQTRWRFAEIDVSVTDATCWDPSSFSSGWSFGNAIFVAGDTVYMGPGFPSSSSDYLTVAVNSPRPHPGPISGPAVVSASQSASYSVTNTAGHTYTWLMTGGTGSSTTSNINVTWGGGPTGTVSVVETNPLYPNCHSDTISLNVTIGGAGIDEYLHADVSVSPNPSAGYFTVDIPDKFEVTRILVYNPEGERVYASSKQKTWRGTSLLDLSRLSSGIYYLSIQTNDGGSHFQKIAIE